AARGNEEVAVAGAQSARGQYRQASHAELRWHGRRLGRRSPFPAGSRHAAFARGTAVAGCTGVATRTALAGRASGSAGGQRRWIFFLGSRVRDRIFTIEPFDQIQIAGDDEGLKCVGLEIAIGQRLERGAMTETESGFGDGVSDLGCAERAAIE